MDTGTLIKVRGRLATTVCECYTRMVYDLQDYDLAGAGYEGGTACSFVDVVYSDTGAKAAVNMSRTPWQLVTSS